MSPAARTPRPGARTPLPPRCHCTARSPRRCHWTGRTMAARALPDRGQKQRGHFLRVGGTAAVPNASSRRRPRTAAMSRAQARSRAASRAQTSRRRARSRRSWPRWTAGTSSMTASRSPWPAYGTVQRLHRGRAGAAGVPSARAPGHDVITAIASRRARNGVHPARRHEGDADLFLAGTGVHHRRPSSSSRTMVTGTRCPSRSRTRRVAFGDRGRGRPFAPPGRWLATGPRSARLRERCHAITPA